LLSAGQKTNGRRKIPRNVSRHRKGEKMKKELFLLLLIGALVSGCSSAPTKPKNPPSANIAGKFVTGHLIAVCDVPDACKTFEVTLNNTTEETIEIDWNRSYYINNGKPDGGLYFDGVVIAQRNNPRSPDIILPKATFQRALAPNNSFELSMFPLAHWVVKTFKGDSHGIYLTIRAGGKEEAINVSVNLKQPK
jgi:hypothetical protein